jgi:hypothetical protein
MRKTSIYIYPFFYQVWEENRFTIMISLNNVTFYCCYYHPFKWLARFFFSFYDLCICKSFLTTYVYLCLVLFQRYSVIRRTSGSLCVSISSFVLLFLFNDWSINWIHTIYTTIIMTTDTLPASFRLQACIGTLHFDNWQERERERKRLFVYDELSEKKDHSSFLENQHVDSTDKTYRIDI